MKRLLFIILSIVFMSAFVSAAPNFVMYEHANQTLGSSFGTVAEPYGVVINNSVNDLYLKGFNKTELDNSTRGIIRDASFNNLSVCAFDANQYCEFASVVKLSGNNTYYLVADGNGSSVHRQRFDGGSGIYYPMRRADLFDFAATIKGDGSFDYHDMYTIEHVNISDTPASEKVLVTLVSPNNDITLASATQNFNATVEPTTDPEGQNNTNATLYIWFSNNSLFNLSVVSLSDSGIETASFVVPNIPANDFKWNVFGCDTVGCDFASNNRSFSTINVTQGFGETLFEGQSADVTLNLTFTNIDTTILAELTWNNTVFDSTKTVIGSDTVNFISTFTVPSGSGTSAGNQINHTWRYWLSDNSINATTDPQSQNVFTLDIDDCSVHTELLFNYTMYDEDDRTYLAQDANQNVSMDIQVTLRSVSDPTATTVYNNTHFQVNPVTVCTNGDVINATGFEVSSQVQYSSAARVTEFHNVQNISLNPTSFPQHISLYDLLTTRSQEFLITYKDRNFVPVSDAVIDITRQYLEIGQFLTVESPKTDTDGQTVGHFVLNDESYTFFVRKGGQLLATIENVRAFCDDLVTGNCRINLNELSSTTQVDDFVNNEGVSYSTNYNDTTRTYQLTFFSIDGTVKKIDLNITKFGIDDTQICQTSLTASSGTLSCAIAASHGNGTAIIQSFVDNTLLLSDSVPLTLKNTAVLNPVRYLIAFVLIITLPMLAFTSVIGTTVLFIVGVVFASAAFLVDSGGIIGPTSAVIWIIVAALILLWKQTRRGE